MQKFHLVSFRTLFSTVLFTLGFVQAREQKKKRHTTLALSAHLLFSVRLARVSVQVCCWRVPPSFAGRIPTDSIHPFIFRTRKHTHCTYCTSTTITFILAYTLAMLSNPSSSSSFNDAKCASVCLFCISYIVCLYGTCNTWVFRSD